MKLTVFFPFRLTYENQADYLSKLYSMHENLNQQRDKYLADAFIKRYVTIPTTKISSKYDFGNNIDQDSAFSMFRQKQYSNSKSNATLNVNSLSQNSVKKDCSPTSTESRNLNENFRDSSSFASTSVMSMSTTSQPNTNSATLSNSKLFQNKNDTNSSNKKHLKTLSEEISIGGKQILEQPQQYQIPIVSNAKIEYSQKLKPFNLESINRIRKMLNLDEENETQLQQQNQPQTQIVKSNSTNSSNLANLKLKLRESRLRHSVKSDTKNHSTIDNNAILIHNLHNMKKNEELSSDSLNSFVVKTRLPSINPKNVKKDTNQLLNTVEGKIFKSTNDNTPLTIAGLNYIPPKKYDESEPKNQQTISNHSIIEKCFLCNHHSEDIEAPSPDLKPLITIITTSKPTSNSNQFYVQHKSNVMKNSGFLYNQNNYRNYRSPAPSPEILI